MDPNLAEICLKKSKYNNSIESQRTVSLSTSVTKTQNIQLTESMIPIHMRSHCFKCLKIEGLISFLCNHTICKSCLVQECFNQIMKFKVSMKSHQKVSQKFHYNCSKEGCLSIINVPTSMICKFLRDEVNKGTLNSFEIDNISYIEGLVTFFDGIYIDNY